MSKKEQTIGGTEKIYQSFEQAAKSKKSQPPTSEEEKRERISQGRTRGRKDCFLPRINTAFTIENDEYIRRMSKARGESMTEFINHCIEYHRNQNIEKYEEFKKFLENT